MVLRTTALPLMKKKKEKEPEIPVPVAPAPAPTPTPIPSSKDIIDVSTLPGRLALAGVDPGQIADAELAQQLRGIYKGQAEKAKPAVESALLERQRIQMQPLLQQIGQITPEQTAKAAAANIPADLTTGIIPEVAASILTKAGVGAAGGALAGAFGGPPTMGGGAVIGAIGGAIYGAATILSSLKDEARQNVKVQKVEFTTSRNNIKAIIEGVNKGLVDPIDAIILYNRELAKIDRSESNLKLLGEKDWLSKAKDELVAIQSFNDFERIRSRTALEQAILRPNPNMNFELTAEIPEETE